MGPTSLGPPTSKRNLPHWPTKSDVHTRRLPFSLGAGTKVSEVIGSVHALYQPPAFPFLQCIL